MGWKDQYVAQNGSKIGVKASPEPTSWKEKYKKRLDEHDAGQDDRDEAAKKRKDALELAQKLTESADLADIDRQKREASGNEQNSYDAQKRSYQYQSSANENLYESAQLKDYLEGYTGSEEEQQASRDALWALANAMTRTQNTEKALTDEAKYWQKEAPLLDYEEKETDAQKLLQKITEDTYLANLDADKRKADGGYQNPFDAEKRSYQFGQQATEYEQQVSEALAYLQENTGETEEEKKLKLFRPYTENAQENRELVQGLSEQEAQLGTTSERLAKDAEYWKQYESADAYDLAMRQQEIANRQKQAEQQAQKTEDMEAYKASGEAYTPGINLPNLQYARGQAERDTKRAEAYAQDPYQKYTEAEDFEELSKLGAAMDNSRGVQNKVTYGRENADMLAASAFIGGDRSENSGYYRYQEMTDDQVNIYNYLLVKEGNKAADEYLGTIESGIDQKLMTNFKEGVSDYAQEYPVAASVASVAATPFVGTGYVVTGIKKLFGQDIDANDPINGPAQFQNAIRGTVANTIAEKHGGVASFLYQTAMSMGDSGASMLMSGGSSWVASGIMGLSAAENAMLDAVGRGADDGQALLSGLYAGAFETLFEKVSIDHLFKMKAGDIKEVLKNILKQGVIEGSEEFATDVANLWGDWLVMGGKSQYDQTLAYYMSEDGGGMPFDDAKKQALLDTAKQIGLDTLGGAISGVAFGGAASGLNAAQNIGNSGKTQSFADVNAQSDPLMQIATEMADEQIQQENAQRAQQEAELTAQENAQMQNTARAQGTMTGQMNRTAGMMTSTTMEVTESKTGENINYPEAVQTGGAANTKTDTQMGRNNQYKNVVRAYSDDAYQKMDNAGRERVSNSLPVMNTLAERGGVQIRLVDSIKATANGKETGANARYNAEDNTIDIALDAQNGAYEYMAAHELTHHIRSKSEFEYGVLSDTIRDVLKKNGQDIDALVQSEMERNGYDEETAYDEVIANSLPAILNNEETVKRIVETNRSLAQRIAEFIKNVLADIKAVGEKLANSASWRQMGSLQNDTKSLQEIGDLFLGALESAGERTRTEGETQRGSAAEDDGARFSLKTGDIVIKDQIVESYSGQTNSIISSEIDGKTVGTLEYAEYEGAPSIQMIKVDPEYRRKGIAKKMLQNLQQKYGDTEIDFGFSTDDGTALLKSVTYNVENKKYSQLINEYEEIIRKIKSNKKNYKNGTLSDADADQWNDLYDRKSEIENEIRNEKPEKTYVRFSLKDVEPDTTVDALIRENEQLKKANELLKAQFRLTQGHVASDAEIGKLAGRVLREYQSRYDRGTLTNQLKELFDYLGNEEAPSWQDVQRIGMVIGGKVIDQSLSMDSTSWEYYKDARARLRGTNIAFNDGQKAEAASLTGSYDSYRKKMFGTVKITNEGLPLDVLWMELSDKYPEIFPENTSDADMPALLLDAAEHMKQQYVNPYEMSRDEAANDVFMRVYEGYLDTPEMKTFADRQKEKYDALNLEYKGVLRDYREEGKNRYDRKLSEIKREYARKRQILSKKIQAEMSEKMKAALRRQYRALSTRQAEKIAEQRARFDKWKNTDRAREKYIPRIEKNARELATWLAKPTDAKHVPQNLRDVVRDFIQTIDLAGDKTTIKANDWRMRLEQVRKAFNEIERGDYDNLSFFADIDPDFAPRLEEFMENSEGIKTVAEMDGEQLTELNYLITGMKRSITYANKLHTNERFETVEEAAERTQEELNARREAKRLTGTTEAIRDLLNADQLDAFAYQEQIGAAGGSMIQALRNGLDQKVRDVKKAEDYAKAAIGKENVRAYGKDTHVFNVSGGEIKLTTAQIMELYLLNRREQARGHIYMGGIKAENETKTVMVTNADVDAICGTLTQQQKQMAEELQKFLGTDVAEWGNEVSMDLYGYKKFTEPNYYPIKSDENFTRSQDEDSKGGGFYRLKNLGMTKTTVQGARNPLVIHDIFDTFSRHIDEMSSYHAFVIPISDGMKWFNYKTELGSTKQSLERALGRAGKQYFTTLIKDINGVKMDGGTDIGQRLLRNAKIAAVAANMRVVLQQPTAYLRAMNMISPKYLAMGLAKLPNISKANKWCPIAQWKSYGFYDLDIGKGLKEILTHDATAANKIRNVSLMPAQQADNITWGYLWNACEAETKAKHPELDVRSDAFNEAVGKRMSMIVDRTQVVDSVFHRSQQMRKKGLMQLFTTFMSEPTKTYNMIRTAAASVARNPQDKAARAKLIRASMTYALTGLFTAAAAALSDAARDDEDRDAEGNERTFQTKYGVAFGENAVDILNPMNMIPVLRDINSYMQGYRSNNLMMKGVEALVSAAKSWKTYFEGTSTKSLYGLTYQTATGISYVAGIPAGNAMRAFEGGYKLLTGKKLEKESETATEAKSYTALYGAILAGNKTTINRMKTNLRNGTGSMKPKSYAEIDAGIAEQLMLNDARIQTAYDAKLAGDARTVLKMKSEVTADGFSGEMFDKAVQRTEETKPVTKDLDKELNVKLFSAEDMATSIIRAAKTGDESSLSLIYSELLADSTAQDPEESTKSNITGEIKPLYLEYYEKGDSKIMFAIENTLMMNFNYKSSEFSDWIKAHNKAKTGP